MKTIRFRSENGFTLLEVMVSLVVATLVVGGVMGVISASMQYSKRVQDKMQDWPVLEAAAQEILTNPEKAEDGSLTLDDLPDSPQVTIQITEVTDSDDKETGNQFGKLYRVRLQYEKQVLEFSLIIPESSLSEGSLTLRNKREHNEYSLLS